MTTHFFKKNARHAESVHKDIQKGATMIRYGIYLLIPLLLIMDFNCAPAVNSVRRAAKEAAEARETAEIRKEAEQGDADAQLNLGDRYANGTGLAEDLEQAFFWFRKAAEQDNALAQFVIGKCYAYGHGVPIDIAQAVVWFRKAAELGNAEAQTRLGMIYVDCESTYSDCTGVPKDIPQAVIWFRKAADQGDGLAMAFLGALYGNGESIPKDLVAAYQWYDLAMAHGWESVGERRDEIAKQMTPEQLSEAQSQTSPNGPQKGVTPL